MPSDPQSTHRACAFCRRTDLKITNEHIYAQRFQDIFPQALTVRHQATTHLEGTETERFAYFAANIDLQVQAMCKDCNGGWMADVDTAAESVLRDVLPATTSRTLNLADQAALATWIVKVSMASEYVAPEHVRVPQWHRDWIAERQIPPRNCFVWIAARPLPNLDGFIGSVDLVRFRHDSLRLKVNDAVVLGVQSYELTLYVGALVSRVVGTTYARPIPSFPAPSADFAQIWPPIPGTSQRLGVLNEQQLEDLFAIGQPGDQAKDIAPES